MESQADVTHQTTGSRGSFDGTGAGDHDQPYCFGRTPSAAATYLFSTRQYARLLVLRGRVRAGDACADDLSPAA